MSRDRTSGAWFEPNGTARPSTWDSATHRQPASLLSRPPACPGCECDEKSSSPFAGGCGARRVRRRCEVTLKTFQVTPTHAPPAHPPAVVPAAGAAQPPAPPPAPAPSPGTVPVSGSTDTDGRPDPLFVLGAFVAVAATAAVTIFFTRHFAYTANPVMPAAGVTIFAVFFVAAQGVERLLEPIASLVKNDSRENLAAARRTRRRRSTRRSHSLGSAAPTPPSWLRARPPRRR